MTEQSNGRAVGALVLLAVGALAVLALVAFKPLTQVATTRVLCPVIDEDGGISAAKISCGDNGYSAFVCTNEQGSANTIYIGGSDVTTATGYPICTSCAGGSVISMDTYQGEVYCTTSAASHDGGTPMPCLCGM